MFLCGILLASAALTLFSVKIVAAEYYAAKQTPEGLARALYLEPGNERYLYLIAHYWHYNLERQDLGLAVAYYHRAITVDPGSTKSWLDLAAAYEELGSNGQAREAYAAALKSHPVSADVALRYGNFLIRQGEFEEAFANIRRALKANPKLASAAIVTCWRADPQIEIILDRALPPLRSVYLDAMRFLIGERADDGALAVWKRLAGIESKLELPYALPLINGLIERDRFADARGVWQEALHAAGISQPGGIPESVIWDGGFEGPIIDGGFGWRKNDVTGVRFDFDTTVKHSGARSFRLTCDGRQNVDFNHLFQYVPVEPHTSYDFSAYIRTEAITTNSGPRFLISDPHNSIPGQVTGQVTGTQPWTRLDLSFTTGVKTNVLIVSLRRTPSEKLDNKLAGTVWIDDVSLIPVEQKRWTR